LLLMKVKLLWRILKEISLEAAPEIINNRTLVPVRAISDAFGYGISWDGERRLVEVNTKVSIILKEDFEWDVQAKHLK